MDATLSLFFVVICGVVDRQKRRVLSQAHDGDLWILRYVISQKQKVESLFADYL